MKQDAILVFRFKGKDLDNRGQVASLMGMILNALERWPLSNLVHWELVSFTKAK